MSAQGAALPTALTQLEASLPSRIEFFSAQAGRSPSLADGVYLYGQATEPEQVGSTYLVFQVTAGQVVGAFYMPYSSFDCFQGAFEDNQLALQITSSYEQVTYPYSIALHQDGAIATSDGGSFPAIGLSGFHQMSVLSENDHRILDMCKADLSAEV